MDKKSDHYTSAETYRDLDGNYKQFTFIDHDIKKYAMPITSISESELADLKRTREEAIEAILAMPAISLLRSGNTLAENYIIRDQEKGIIWHEKAVKEALIINPDLIYLFSNTVWRNTVKEQNWFTELSNKEIIEGKWKELI